MIPPKSPPKPKRTRNAKPPASSEDDIDLLILDDEGESAFQFDQCNKAELTSIEDLSGSGFKNKSSKKNKKDKATEDYKLLEAVHSVHKAVQSNNREDTDSQQPPIPPYPDVSSLRLDEVNDKMASSVSQSAQYSHNIQHSSSFDQSAGKPKHVFSDDELSEIFQIDFGQIFGNPDSGRKNNYKGIQIKKSAQAQNNLSSSVSSPPLSPVPPPLEFQSSPKVTRSKSDAAVPERNGVIKSKSMTIAGQRSFQ